MMVSWTMALLSTLREALKIVTVATSKKDFHLATLMRPICVVLQLSPISVLIVSKYWRKSEILTLAK